MLRYVLFHFIGDPGQPRDVSSEHIKKGNESSKVKLTWKRPSELSNNLLAHITYHLQYCNKKNCNNRTNIRTTELIVDDLAESSTYYYTLTTMREDKLPGGNTQGTFTTKEGK